VFVAANCNELLSSAIVGFVTFNLKSTPLRVALAVTTIAVPLVTVHVDPHTWPSKS
jgi:hypothetical protein